MTKTSAKYLVPAIIATGLFLASLIGLILSQQAKVATAGVSIVDVYKATTTSSLSASASASFKACTGHCTVGSIVVVQPASAGWVQLWDATSTATSTYSELRGDNSMGSSTPFTTLGRPITQVLAASDVVGTLMFDIGTYQGLVIETSSNFDGQYVVTYK